MVMDYRIQQQINDVMAFGMRLIFMAVIFEVD